MSQMVLFFFKNRSVSKLPDSRKVMKLILQCILLAFLSINNPINAEDEPAPLLSADEVLQRLEHIKDVNSENSPLALKLLSELEKSISNTSPVSIRREYLSVLISAQTESGALDAAWNNAIKLTDLGRKESDKSALADGLTSQGSVLVTRGKLSGALPLFRRGIELAEAEGNHKIAQFAYNNLALAENSLGNFQDALTYFLKAVEHAELVEKGRERSMAVLLNNISLLYMSLKNPDKGLEYNRLAFEMAEKSGTKGILATLALNRGYAYDEIGEEEKAYLSYKEGLRIARENDSIRSEAVALINISDYFLRQKDYETSAEYGTQALLASEKTGEQSYIATSRINMGLALAGKGEAEEGAEQVIAALDFFKKSDNKLDVESVLGELAQLYQSAGMYQLAMETLIEKMALSEELFKSDREKAVTELQEQFDAAQRQKKIELLERDNQLKNTEIENKKLQQQVTMLGVVLVVFGAVLVFLLYRKVQKTNLQLKAANSQLEIQSICDPLTGLFNRRSFLNLMSTRGEFEDRRNINDENPDSLVLLDVDNFKQVNDIYGHAAGDTVLIEIAKRLKKLMRDTDMVLRWGGEEFLVFIKQPDPQHIKILVKRILDTIGSKPISIGDKSLTITVSAGQISLPFCDMSEQEFNWERALQLADMALYLGKVHGRNRAYCVARLLAPFDEVQPILEKDLAEAMRQEMVEVYAVEGPESE